VDRSTEPTRLDVLGEAMAADARLTSDRFATAAGLVPGEVAFLARLDGQPAGVGSVHLGPQIATFGGMATLTAHRGQGVQAALLRYRLRVAATAGASLAMLTAQPDGPSARNIERAGFVRAYTALVMGLPRPAPAGAP